MNASLVAEHVLVGVLADLLPEPLGIIVVRDLGRRVRRGFESLRQTFLRNLRLIQHNYFTLNTTKKNLDRVLIGLHDTVWMGIQTMYVHSKKLFPLQDDLIAYNYNLTPGL